MGIQYVTDESGRKVAVVIPMDEWDSIVSELGGEPKFSVQDEEDRRRAYEELSKGDCLDLGEAMSGW